jgi:hypothetical protein
VVGVGPQLGFIFPVGNMQGYLNLKGYGDFAAQNRPHGGTRGSPCDLAGAADIVDRVDTQAYDHQIRGPTAPTMTPEQVDLITRSFDAIWPVRRKLSGLFYSRFFELAPDAERCSPGTWSDSTSS